MIVRSSGIAASLLVAVVLISCSQSPPATKTSVESNAQPEQTGQPQLAGAIQKITPEQIAAGKERTVALPNFTRCMVQQQTPVWCWAACAEMVHRYSGSRVTQQEIAERIMGRDKSNPDNAQMAKEAEVIGALNPQVYALVTKDDIFNGNNYANIPTKFNINFDSKRLQNLPKRPDMSLNAQQLANDLISRRPVILAMHSEDDPTSGHIVVIHGADLLQNPDNTCSILQITFANPSTGLDEQLDGEALQRRADFVATQASARKYLDYLRATEQIVTVRTGGGLMDRWNNQTQNKGLTVPDFNKLIPNVRR